MKWNERPSDQTPVPDGWGLGETSGLAPNRSSQKHTKTLPPDSMGDEVFWGVNGKLYFLTWEHPKKIAFMLPSWWKGPTASERVFIIRDVACALNGIWRETLPPPPTSTWEKSSSLSLLNQLWFIQEKWKNQMSQLWTIFPFFSCLVPSTTFLQWFYGSYRREIESYLDIASEFFHTIFWNFLKLLQFVIWEVWW